MKRRKLKPFVVPAMYVMSIAMLVGSVYCIERLVNNTLFNSSDDEVEVERVILSDDYIDEALNDMPVVSTDIFIMRPYSNANVKIVKNYYDYLADGSSQENSIIYYGNTYMQNSGVDYGMTDKFEAISILDGTVLEVLDDEIMGKTVKVKHSNDLISVYQSLSEILVKENDVIGQGAIVGYSGEANISPELGNHLHFELYHKGSIVNPENYYDNNLNELN